MSSKLNRLHRCVIKEFRDQLIKDIKEGETVAPSAVKTMLCYMDKDFPRDSMGLPLSFTKITNKEGSMFLEYIFREGGQRGFKFDIIESEWARLIKEIR